MSFVLCPFCDVEFAIGSTAHSCRGAGAAPLHQSLLETLADVLDDLELPRALRSPIQEVR